MRAGEMKYRLLLQRLVVARDRFGSEVQTWEDAGWCYAQRVNVSGNRRSEVAEHFSDYHAVFNIRDSHKVGDHWRVEQIGGYLYEVVSVIPNINRGMLSLKCERVNQ